MTGAGNMILHSMKRPMTKQSGLPRSSQIRHGVMATMTYVAKSKYHDVDAVIEEINNLGRTEMWNDMSPIWLRPQRSGIRLYKPRKLLQVVGHTPMDEITREKNLISSDVFSTYRDGRPIGTQEFLLLDTETWEYAGIKSDILHKE